MTAFKAPLTVAAPEPDNVVVAASSAIPSSPALPMIVLASGFRYRAAGMAGHDQPLAPVRS